MSHRRNQLRNDPPFAERFKPAVILGRPSAEQLRNNIFLELQNERFNENQDRLLYLDTPTKMNEGNRSPLTIRTTDPALKPVFHPVEVVDLKESFDHAFVIEGEIGARGISVLLLKETQNADSEIYANVYTLPFCTFSDIIFNTNTTPVNVKVKQSERIKLQVTIRPSATGEANFNTHDTEVLLPEMSKDRINQLKNQLQFEAAAELAHFVSQLVEIEAKEEISHHTRLHPQLFSATLKNRGDGWSFTNEYIGPLVCGAGVVVSMLALEEDFPDWAYLAGGVGLLGIALGIIGNIGAASSVSVGSPYMVHIVEKNGNHIVGRILISKDDPSWRPPQFDE